MLRYEPAFRCGKVCHKHNTGTLEYTKSELDTNYTNFGCRYIPKAAYTASMSALSAAQAAVVRRVQRTGRHRRRGLWPCLRSRRRAPRCTLMASRYLSLLTESRASTTWRVNTRRFGRFSPTPCGISSASPVMLSVEAVMHHHGFCVSLAVCL